MRAIVLATTLIGAGCSWPSHQFGGDGGIPTEDTASLPTPTSCPLSPETAGFCAELRAFGGSFALDGKGDEFCREDDAGPRAPPRRFSVTEAARVEPSPPPAGHAEKFEVRAGLDAYGVHVFVQVQGDRRVVVDRDDPVRGDAVEIFLRGRIDRELVGALDADEAQHLVLTPPTAAAEGVAWLYFKGKPKDPLDGSVWRSRRVQGGWEVELHQPWSSLKNQPSPGMVMGFDVALDLDDDDASPGREVRVLMHAAPVTSSPSCTELGITPADPSCDDRTFCLAKAYIP